MHAGRTYQVAATLAAVAIYFIFIADAVAATAQWDGSSGSWSDASAWSTNPLFPNNGNGGQTFDVSVNDGDIDVDIEATIETYSQDGGIVSIAGADEILTINGIATLASSGTATLNIADGARAAINTFGSIGKTGVGRI